MWCVQVDNGIQYGMFGLYNILMFLVGVRQEFGGVFDEYNWNVIDVIKVDKLCVFIRSSNINLVGSDCIVIGDNIYNIIVQMIKYIYGVLCMFGLEFSIIVVIVDLLNQDLDI